MAATRRRMEIARSSRVLDCDTVVMCLLPCWIRTATLHVVARAWIVSNGVANYIPVAASRRIQVAGNG